VTYASWRTGTSVGRTIYIQSGDVPSKQDKLIGMMDTPAMADLVVVAVNYWMARHDGAAVDDTPTAEGAPTAADPCD
jgi:hypothetical protein